MGMGDVARGRDARGRWREVLLPRSNGCRWGNRYRCDLGVDSEVAHVSLIVYGADRPLQGDT